MSAPSEFVFAKAAAIHGDAITGVLIRITDDLPGPFSTRAAGGLWYGEQAAGLAEALYLSLPQGTFDRLILELMAKKVSLYRGRTE